MQAAAAPATETASGLAARFALRVAKRPVEEEKQLDGPASSTAEQARLQVAADAQLGKAAAAGGSSATRGASEKDGDVVPSLAGALVARFLKAGSKALQPETAVNSQQVVGRKVDAAPKERATGALTPGQMPVVLRVATDAEGAERASPLTGAGVCNLL